MVKKKFNLSIKFVQQRDGTDKDPNNVQLMLLQKKSKVIPPPRGRIEIDETRLPIICSKCGCKGHLPSECYSIGSGYQLLSSEDEQRVEAQNKNDVDDKEETNETAAKKKKAKKEKKENKKKDKKKIKDKDKNEKHKNS